MQKTQELYIPSGEYPRQFPPAGERLGLNFGTFVILEHGFTATYSIPNLFEAEDSVETSITLQAQRLLEELENLYVFENHEEIGDFLFTNDYLMEILFEAPANIYRVFGQVPIHLELHRDPEEGWDELFIIIKSPYSAEDAITLQEKLAEDWFLDRMTDTRGKLNITEEPL